MISICPERLKAIIIEAIEKIGSIPFVPVLVSNRHIHLSQMDVDTLFGVGYKLTPTKELLPGQFACQETLTITGERGSIKKVRVLLPTRPETQLEISKTDSYSLGLHAPLNESGNLTNAASVFLENPLNSSRIKRECAIIAKRHIHLTPEFAAKHSLRDKQIVSVDVDSERGIILKDVIIRISADFEDVMHIDTDEANAGLIKNGNIGRIIVSSEANQDLQTSVYTSNVLTRADLIKNTVNGEIIVGKDCVITTLAIDTAREKNINIKRQG